MPIDLKRPTLTRDVQELGLEGRLPPGQIDLSQAPPPPELVMQNRPVSVQGPNPFLSILSDVLMGVSNPQAAQRQQLIRQHGVEDIFSRAQEGAQTRSRFAEQQHARQLQQAKLDEPEFRVDAKGNVTIINPAALRKGDFKTGVVRIEKAKELDPAAFEGEIGRLEKMFGVTLENEEKAALFISFQDAIEADDITPFRQTFTSLIKDRAVSKRQERTLAAQEGRQADIDARQDKRFQQQIDLQNRNFAHQEKMADIRERNAILRQQNSPQNAKNIENAQSGLRALAKVRGMLFDKEGKLSAKGKDLLLKGAIPGSLGAREFAAIRNEMMDVLTRLRTGAALNQNEQEFYAGQMPGALDITEPEAIKSKLKILEDMFNGLSGGRRLEAAPKTDLSDLGAKPVK